MPNPEWLVLVRGRNVPGADSRSLRRVTCCTAATSVAGNPVHRIQSKNTPTSGRDASGRRAHIAEAAMFDRTKREGLFGHSENGQAPGAPVGRLEVDPLPRR